MTRLPGSLRAFSQGSTGLYLLLLLAACGDKTPPVESGPPPERAVWLEDVTAETGLIFEHDRGATDAFVMPEIVGPGGGLIDYDGDGDLDVLLLQGGRLDVTGTAEERAGERKGTGHRLFRNRLVPTGELSFADATAEAGLLDGGYGMGVAAGDLDNDGNLDLVITHYGPDLIYFNRGGAYAEPIALPDPDPWSTSAALLDYDLDGDLDLFINKYVDFPAGASRRCTSSTGAPEYCGPQVFPSLPDRLWRNDGGGAFTDVSGASGIGAAPGAGLGVTVADFDGDGLPDLYVANDGEANHLWINLGDGRFEERGLLSGSAYNMDGRAEASMGVSAGDLDNDGDEDLFMTHLAAETNTLYLNDGKGNFFDSTARLGLGAGSLPYTGFGARWVDLDNDGLLDLYIANGAVLTEETQRGNSDFPYAQRNQLFHNAGRGLFREITPAIDPGLGVAEVSRGAAFGDVDNDGDQDILVTNTSGPARLLLNRAGDGAHWLSLRLRATGGNRDALGARVALLRPDGSRLWRRAHSDGSYLSASDARVHFGLGDDMAFDAIGVVWPGGRRELWRGLAADALHELVEGSGEPWP